jgi:hypothetical protein
MAPKGWRGFSTDHSRRVPVRLSRGGCSGRAGAERSPLVRLRPGPEIEPAVPLPRDFLVSGCSRWFAAQDPAGLRSVSRFGFDGVPAAIKGRTC